MENVVRLNNADKDVFAFSGFNLNDNQIVLAFRGTNGPDLQNWITNLNSFTVPYPGASGTRVHKGFLFAYSKVRA